ncbi:TetR/AcrR family transcriptional regulator [Agrilactobacillus fermenti]|uniref:TetR/AcrR family transcriptional regulator n=1 Tax=Agrilactobacillus fermenti TaxID=2586909 RepID=UPI001E382088|nr:TetR/AcrR family transcriptional regulator [Agrilactobacillus fermenti]MCD2255100.1 TetR/AcrR family transcriptional regulator [Agrilactobacillus fermenti]
MSHKQDLRVIRTRKLIVEAFQKLVRTEGFEQITVQEIADEAMINRATFYAHFKDKQDLYHYIFANALTSIKEVLSADIWTKDRKVALTSVDKMLAQFFTLVQENHDFFKSLVNTTNVSILKNTLQELLKHQYAEIFDKLRIKQGQTLIPTSFIIAYMTAIFISNVQWWLNTDSNFSPEHMAHLTIQLIANGHLTVLGIEVVDNNS